MRSLISNSDIQSDDGPDDDNNEIEMFCGEEERVPDSVSGASDGESQDDYDLMESDLDEDYSELSAFCMWYCPYHTGHIILQTSCMFVQNLSPREELLLAVQLYQFRF